MQATSSSSRYAPHLALTSTEMSKEESQKEVLPSHENSTPKTKEKPQPVSRLARIKASVKNKQNIKLAACYWALGTAGWNDASLGPLIPYMETYFSIGYTIVATMFIAQCVGYLIAGLSNNRVTDKFGMGKVITAGAFFQTLAYAVCISPPPFPVLPVAWSIVGLGVAYQDAQANAWVAGLPDAHIKLGYLHGAYGVGALLSPLVATAFVEAGIRFSFFFSVSLAIAATDVVVLFLCFWMDKERMDHEEQRPSSKVIASSALTSGQNTPAIELKEMDPDGNGEGRSARPNEQGDSYAEPQVVRTTSSKDKEIFSNRYVWFTAAFLLLYVGAEVSIGGWIVSFLIDERNGNSSAGYVASGFWAGIALGRLVLPRFNNWFGERNVVFLYIILALGLEMVVWFAKQLIANAVAVSLVGFILGPFFPIGISVIGKLLPRYLHSGAIGLIAAVGSAGAAIFPFITGALAQKYGTWVLQPVIVSLLVAMAVVWVNVPTPERKRL